MPERGRLPRRFIDDRRGYPEVRVVEDRRAYPDIRVVEDRRGYPGIHVAEERRGYHDIHEGPRMRGAPRPHPAILDEELELQQVELCRLLADNRALVEERTALHREVQGGKDEVRYLNMIIADIKTEKEDYISKLVDKRRKLESELRAHEHLRDEVVHLRGEIDKLAAARKELSAEAASLMQELTREKSAKQQLPMLKAELDGLQQELTHVRTACGLEQKGNFELVEQRKAMEKNMISMAQEIKQMRAEVANFEARPWGTGGAYEMQMGSPEVTFATPYGDNYNIQAGASEKGPLHPPESSSWGSYDKNRLQYR
ncbi:protein FLX-like 3 [Phragmites australis]|uniref:protein FLX-like 3 n=1 Tax=Phragmites australis TaxID=29695 RepID=UPI002D78B091|nr:protein FLX-like 3 [Phragmites australis]